MKKVFKRAFFATVFVSSVFTFSQAAVLYNITDLGTLGGTYSVAKAINDSGQVVGESWTAGNSAQHAFLYDNGTMTYLGTLGGYDSYACSINNNGQIVGHSYIAEGSSYNHAFLYDGGTMTDLGTLGGSNSNAYGINNSGQVVGSSWIAGNNSSHAFLYEGGTWTDLGTLGGNNSRAHDINDNGQIVGYSQNAEHNSRAFLYDGGTMTDLGTLGGGNSYAHGINDSGQVVGYSWIAESSFHHAFLYENGVMTNLGTLGGGNSYARGINDSGQVVGYSRIAGSSYNHAFLYDGSMMLDLNDLIPLNSSWELGEAWDINSSGQIVGNGTINNETHAYLLTPVPEPVIAINLDVKPGSCPNPVNVKSKGMLPVAILGTEEFEVSAIDAASIFLNGVPAIRSSYKDVAGPVANPNECECTTEAGDGFGDLVLKFKTQDIVETLGQVNTGDILTLPLMGVLNDGTGIEGSDCVVIVGRHKPINKADINEDGVVNTVDIAIVAENWLQSSIVEE